MALMDKYPEKSWINPKLEVRETKIGKGMFTKEPLKEGEVVVIWGGDAINTEGAKLAEEAGKLVLQWDDDVFSVEDRGDDPSYYINHSCDPNLWMEGVSTLVTRKDIKAGEELTADYALWEADENYVSKWECHCGSPFCRHKITGQDWRFPELQQRYRNHFSKLINKRISQLDS